MSAATVLWMTGFAALGLLAAYLFARWLAGKFRTATGAYLRRVANTARRCPKTDWPGW